MPFKTNAPETAIASETPTAFATSNLFVMPLSVKAAAPALASQSVPMPLLPGARMPLAETLTAPLTVPVPPRVAPALTETALPEAVDPLINNVPDDTVVAPV